ncbi:hypothetical protein K491DRAFT_82382 [Lophiostoma macrostomum CBS 122681]|uniref:Cupredoxin n=1 Tax=Lophiostoma macrostomum CBS 122681 TaxID=1314788 RepID=A0A6A6SZS6_9PLEO|nr:hypothetical protein K491DRAFT_82382 [Lophiostoma macrostomum CBS 122681]
MLFNSMLLAAATQTLSASAATMMVTVAANNQFQFTPNSVTAQPGDMVAFNFVAQVSRTFLFNRTIIDSSQNHSVASSTANAPCRPEQNAIFSDFQPIPGNPNGSPNGNAGGNAGNGNARGKKGNNKRQNGNTPMFMVPITDTNPMYIYCSQAQHCQQGMVMVINPPNTNAVQQYAQKAAKANKNVSPRGGMSGGQVVNNLAGTNPKNVLGANAGDAAGTQTNNNNNNNNGGAAGGLAALLGGKGKGKGKGN